MLNIHGNPYTEKCEIRTFPIMAKIPTIYLFEIQLDDAVIPVWRILEVPRTITLHELHLCIQVAMGWECRHLYEFFFREKRYEIPEPMTPVGDEIKDPRVVKLIELDLELGESLAYTYDFGDGWQHTVTFKGYSRKEYGYKHLPRCSSGAMACPPEDIGGIPVYNELIDFLVNKQPMTIFPDLEVFFKKFDPWDDDITPEYSFDSAVKRLGRLYK